jgi:phage baseplate assembly protein V
MVHGFNRSDQGTAGVGMPEATDTARRLHNAIRYGVVHEADYDRAEIRVSVQDGELITDWLPWLTLRAFTDAYWWAPEVGEVVILIAPSGEMSNAVALPAAFSNQNQPANRPTVQRAVFADGAVVEYDRESHRYSIDLTAAPGSEIWIQCEQEIHLNAEKIYLNSDGGSSYLPPDIPSAHDDWSPES